MKTIIASYLKENSKTLGSLLTKLNQLKLWNSWLYESLPEDKTIALHCKIVKLDGTSLIVIADNPHWVTRFRFFIPELITKLRVYPDFIAIQAICCKVKPNYLATNKKNNRPRLQISAKNAEMVRETANKIRHAKLRSILKKMAGD